MGKLRVFSGRDVCHILAQHGFAEVRHRGSHIVMHKKIPGSTLTVPVPDHAEVRIGTLQSIVCFRSACVNLDSHWPTVIRIKETR